MDEVIVPPQTDGTWTIIDWGTSKPIPHEWDQFDEEERAHIKANYPDDYAKFFAHFEE